MVKPTKDPYRQTESKVELTVARDRRGGLLAGPLELLGLLVVAAPLVDSDVGDELEEGNRVQAQHHRREYCNRATRMPQ